MTRDEIIRMAREAGILRTDLEVADFVEVIDIKIFADMVAKAEREACAKVCEEQRDDWLRGLGRYEFMAEGADFCADAIRARGEQ